MATQSMVSCYSLSLLHGKTTYEIMDFNQAQVLPVVRRLRLSMLYTRRSV